MQETREIPQDTLWHPGIESLRDSRGVVDMRLDICGIDPEQKVNMTTLTGRMGENFGPVPTDIRRDPLLDVYPQNFQVAHVNAIESGLYVPPNDLRTRREEDLLITIGHQACELNIKGVVPRNAGVVFPRSEYKKVARNAADFAKSIRAGVLQNNIGPDQEEARAKASRGATEALQGMLTGMDTLEGSLLAERQLLEKVYRQNKTSWQAQYKAKNLDKLRKNADELIHEAADTAAITLNLGTVALAAMHRAITSNLYRRGSRSELNYRWREYTAMAGRYSNARRGKVWQSRADCEEQLAKLTPSLPAVA